MTPAGHASAMWDMDIRLVRRGTCTVDPGNVVFDDKVLIMRRLGIGGGSTAAPIMSGSELLLVDTGYEREEDASLANDERNRDELACGLRSAGLAPADVTSVFVTHFHKDHYGGIELFPRAKWLCHRGALADFHGPLRDRFAPLGDGDEIVRGATVLHTPGHTRGHSSVLRKGRNGPAAR